ncbi:MAG: hypothetical protein KZQ66_18060 [Candidatus Thiodiazotropha sp. (ex Lucinoma aequizonata)]|nr:hypothetical protein [Candidatus Thiodiazotropha sp. (ex Lucinoma aequizonata)]MCU7888179.1 hypothetical protein [Candidatus Thiodiazotropha sp. (ex Lucinoma aequizonata)]MCU7894518.1 hypothetical protein [Candidatus Thiodiazotropha sp. (ex Lucinoma aequizonata)]MCU7897453.1 hypothetical protein [Candidatus Thiodiazotropha sp. (ex Lucinoma aequizonata)]MCU7903652.1 hypothetical protein [Candidatus Thiodiazotropha sp. (ex Lucinoma aequizonata)]
MRLRLIAQRGYSDIELPCTRTLRNKLNELGDVVKEFCTPQLNCFFPFQQLFLIVSV